MVLHGAAAQCKESGHDAAVEALRVGYGIYLLYGITLSHMSESLKLKKVVD